MSGLNSCAPCARDRICGNGLPTPFGVLSARRDVEEFVAEITRDWCRVLHFMEYAAAHDDVAAASAIYALALAISSCMPAEVDPSLYMQRLEAYRSNPHQMLEMWNFADSQSDICKTMSVIFSPHGTRWKVRHGVKGTPVDTNHNLHQVALCMKCGMKVSAEINSRILKALQKDLLLLTTPCKSTESHADEILGSASPLTVDEGVLLLLQRILGPSVDPQQLQTKHVRQIELQQQGNFVCPQTGASFVFEDVAPDVFRHLRHLAGLSTGSYLESICKEEEDLICFASNSRSGQLFFFSDDGLYLVKSITEAEAHKLMEILPAYRNHLETYRNSLLTRIFGLHRTLINYDSLGGMVGGYKSCWFIVMANICYTSLGMHESYDLKGSTYNRRVSQKGQGFQSDKMYKDEDFLDRIKEHGTLRMGSDTRNELVWQHGIDTAFLESLGIMDYSILLHIHDTTKADGGDLGFGSTSLVSPKYRNSDKEEKDGGHCEQHVMSSILHHIHDTTKAEEGDLGSRPTSLDAPKYRNSDKEEKDGGHCKQHVRSRHLGEAITSEDGRELYYIGIVDILDTFNLARATQDVLLKVLNTVTRRNAEYSSVEPKRYRLRQMKFFRAAVGFPPDS